MTDSRGANLETFSMSDMVRIGAKLRTLADDSSSMEDVATKASALLRGSLTDEDGQPACPLVRVFVTHPYGQLPPHLQGFARGVLGEQTAPWDRLRCLTLLGTSGERPEWNSRDGSRGHQAIPLFSEEFVKSAPMVRNLIGQFGIDIRDVVEPDSSKFREMARQFNVFHVADARGNPIVPGQADFVVPYGIRSVLGFGGPLPSGDIFAVILFSRVAIPPVVARLFQTLSLGLKVALLRFAGKVFP